MAFTNHRKKLMNEMEPESMALVYSGIPVRSNEDHYYEFQANSQFFYLTGLERHGMCLLLAKTCGEEREILFIDPFDPMTERWTGKMPTKEEVTAVSGVKEVMYTSDLNRMLHRLAAGTPIHICYMDTSMDSPEDLPDYNLVKARELMQKYPDLQMKSLYKMVAGLRTAKDEDEISDIRKAIAITEKGLDEVMAMLQPGRTEYQVQAAFEYRCHYEGAKRMAFSTIAAAGKNACMMHYVDNDKVLEDGEMILLDLGAKYHNYCSDITRTYPANGRFSPRQRLYYDLVLKANHAVAAAARPGMTLRDLQDIASNTLAEGLIALGKISDPSQIRKYYMHGVSHSIGIDVHDINIGKNVLQPGWIISNEPGLYIDEEGIGIRIEDDLLITEEGCEVLSESIIKDPDEIEKRIAELQNS